MTLHFTKNLISSTKVKYTLFSFLIVTLSQIFGAKASDGLKIIELASLGKFEKKFSEIQAVQFIKGQSLIGRVDYMSGKNYSVHFPFDSQRVNYLVANGSLVTEGDTIAIIEGYDAHHFIDEFKSAKELLAIQEMHFQSNLQYFENKTIKSSQWIEITKSYHEAKLKVEHFQHQMSFLHIDEKEQISLISPKTGIIIIPNLAESKMSGELAFDIVDKNAIKVKVTIPLLTASNLSYFSVNPSCQLNISSIDKTADSFHQTVWAEPSSQNCKLALGQILKVIPVTNIKGYKIAKSALFELHNNNYVAVKYGEALRLIPVVLIGTSQDDYIFTTTVSIEGEQGLVSSVSILQGNLLHLGSE